MAKQLNVNLAFTADTGKAKTQIQELQNSLTNLMNSTATGKMLNTSGMSESIAKASQAAAQLKVQLENATNVNTGKLDLTKFMSQLKSSGISLKEYQAQLSALGPEGTQTFSKLTQAITMAEVPIMRANSKLKEFGTTLMNTARWQISSSILHGFMGSIQTAYYYAQNLNESLNNIRIVTGYGVDEMAKFADQANRAARELSTTTTDYTNASLIYYQQGLNDSQVKERTDVTIKMANVARESAETVSTQMTAVWNNFDDGSKSLEYYADVMTALGAATASSTAEISDGLQKFASVAETVGLSYEYATSALATVTATTRESASVVGTALKTLFARIQGLQLGQTLEDGVDLNKYSEALDKVGVSIFEANGEMKAMDNILDETAAKWDTLTEAEQMALAQTVAGVRQYTQFMALMNNWDFMEQNLDVAYGAEGTLDAQAEIYAESWEAASKRVRASAENLYSSLLDDDFFIDMNNLFADMLTGVAEFIKGMGGFKSVALMIGTVFASVFRNQIVSSIDDTISRFKVFTKAGQNSISQFRNEANSLMLKPLDSVSQKMAQTTSGQAELNSYKQIGILQQAALNNAKNMSAEQKVIAQHLMDQQQVMANKVQLAAEEQRQSELAADNQERNALRLAKREATGTIDTKALKQSMAEMREVAINYDLVGNEITELQSRVKGMDLTNPKAINEVKKFTNETRQLFTQAFGDNFNPNSPTMKAFNELAVLLDRTSVEGSELSAALNKVFDEYVVDLTKADEATNKFRQILTEAGVSTDTVDAIVDDLAGSYTTLAGSTADLANKEKNLNTYTNQLVNTMNQLVANQSIGQVFMTIGTSMTSVVTIFNSFKSMFQSLTNPDLSGMEKFMAILTAIGMIIPTVTMALNAQNVAALQVAGSWLLQNTSIGKLLVKMGISIPVKFADAAASKVQAEATEEVAEANAKAAISTGALMVAIIAIVAVVAILALAIWGIVKAVEAAKANSPEGQLQAAKEKAEELATALDEAKNSAEELRSAFDEYGTVRDTLDNCIKGTEEWNEALKENNETVLELMRNFPELASMINDETGESAIYRGENGELVIADWAMEQMQGKADASVEALTTASIQQNQVVRDRELGVELGDMRQDIVSRTNDIYQEEVGISNASAFYAGNKYGTDANGYAIRNSDIYDMAIANADILAGLTAEEAGKALFDFLTSQGVTSFNVTAVDALAKAIVDDENFDSYAAQAESNKEANRIEDESIVSNVLQEDFGQSKYIDDLIATQGRNYDQYLEEATQNDIEALKKGNEEIAQEYADIMGIAAEDIEIDEATGNVKYQTRNDEGKLVWSDYYSAEDIASLTAVNEANQMVVNSANALVTTLANLEAAGTGAAEALYGLIVDDNLQNTDQAGLHDFTEQVTGYGIDTATQNPETYLDDEGNLKEAYQATAETDYIAENWDDYGYESAQAFADAYNKATADAIKAWDEINKDEFLSPLAESGYDMNDIIDFSNVIEDNPMLQLTSGFEESINGILNNTILSQDQKEKFLEIFNSTDWSAPDSWDNFVGQLGEAGINVQHLGSDFINLQNVMDNATPDNLIASSEQLLNNFQEAKELAGDLSLGDIITEEQYKLLLAYNEELAKYFVYTGSGYKMVGGEGQIDDINVDNAIAVMQQQQSAYEDYTTGNQFVANGQQVTDWNKYGSNNTSASIQAEALGNILSAENQGAAQLLELSGYDSAYIENVIAGLSSGDEDIQANAQAAADIIFGALQDSITAGASGQYNMESQQQVQAVNAEHMSDLEALNLEESNPEAYSDGLRSLASEYETCTTELEAYNKAIEEYGEGSDEAKKAQGELNKAIKKAEWDKFTDEALEYAEALENCTDPDEIESNLVGIQDAFREAFGMEVPMETLIKYKDEFIKWANASEEESDDIATHINSLINADNFDFAAYEDNWEKTIEISADTDPAIVAMQQLTMDAQTMKGIVEANPPVVHADGTADFSGMIAAMLEAGGTAADVAAALQLIGQTTVDFSAWGTELGTYDFNDPESALQFTRDFANWQGNLDSSGDATGANVIQRAFPDGSIPTVGGSGGGRHGGGSGGGGGGGGGGGSSNPAKRITRTKKSDMVERYKELNDQIERVQNHQENLNNSMDGLYGKDRQAQVQEYLKALEKEIDLIDQKIKKNKEYLAEDTSALQEAAKKLGVTLKFNADGTIANYEEIMTKLWKKQREMEDKQAAMSTQEAQDEYSESTMEPFQEDVDALTEAMDDYYETLEEGMDLQNQLMDKIREDIEVMLDDVSTTIEETFDLADSQLDIIDYYAGKMEDSFYGSAESVKYMLESFELIGAKIDGVTAGLGQLDDVIAKANQMADEYGLTETQRKELVEAQVVEFLMEQQGELIDNLEELNDLDTDMMDAYENALDKMNEELEEYTEHFEHLVSLTEHYITLSELIGGDTNYDALMKAYDAQSMVLGNQINSEKAHYDALIRQREMLDAQRAQYLAAGDDAAVKLIEEQLQDVTSQLFEVQDNIYGLVAEQAEATRAKVEAQINAQNLTLEKALTGGTSFEYMNTQMEHRVALQEEYLTTTNKIYETTKLMRTAQNAIDETTNSVAKQKLKNFMRETEQLQKQTKLSKYELDIQQAKYDLLLAEIALEEAQDAKSTVRLTRDAEGNFGYVYTADQNQIAEAQQKLEDAQNKLYNLSLEGANDYTQKYQETLEAMYEELAAVNEDFTLTEEERMARMEEIQAHYYEQLMQFSSLYQVALSTDTRVAADAWSTEFNSIMSSTDDYMSHLETYSDNVMGIWKDWGSTLSNLQAWLEEIDLEAIVAESADLSDQITQDGGVIDSLEAEMDAVNELVNSYAAMRKEILETVKEVEALMQVVNNMIQTAAGGDMESIREWAASLTGSNYGSSMAIDTSSSSMGRPADFTLSADLYEAILNSIDVNTATLMSAQMLGAIVPASEGQLEQNVYINASFPNANNQYEIEQALVNLANRATQYTNRLTK